MQPSRKPWVDDEVRPAPAPHGGRSLAPGSPPIGALTPSEWNMLDIVDTYGPLTLEEAVHERVRAHNLNDKQVRKRARLPLYRLLSWELIRFVDDAMVASTPIAAAYLDEQSEGGRS